MINNFNNYLSFYSYKTDSDEIYFDRYLKNEVIKLFGKIENVKNEYFIINIDISHLYENSSAEKEVSNNFSSCNLKILVNNNKASYDTDFNVGRILFVNVRLESYGLWCLFM